MGGKGNNALYGEAGNDRIQAEGGINTLSGGEGDDYLDLYTSTNSRLYGGVGDDSFWIFNKSSYNTLIGGDGNDDLNCLEFSNHNTLIGGEGDNVYTLYDRCHYNTIYGGSGKDVVALDSSHNTIFLEGGNDFYWSRDYSLYIDGTHDKWVPPSYNIVHMGQGNDKADMHSAIEDQHSKIYFEEGNDKIRAYHDLQGEKSYTVYDMGSGQDEVDVSYAVGSTFQLGEGDDKADIFASNYATVYGGAGKDDITLILGFDRQDRPFTSSRNTVYMGDGDDKIVASFSPYDSLDFINSDDHLYGEGGNDYLEVVLSKYDDNDDGIVHPAYTVQGGYILGGGAGQDTFVLSLPVNVGVTVTPQDQSLGYEVPKANVIIDFEHGQDHLQFKGVQSLEDLNFHMSYSVQAGHCVTITTASDDTLVWARLEHMDQGFNLDSGDFIFS
jgi:Ca2+-binding RTX toxin-like protein